MKRRSATSAAALLAALLLAGCGTSAGMTSREPKDAARREMKVFLADAQETAKGYGMDHLGHYLKMDLKSLKREGLRIPKPISVKLTTDHTGYCITATHEGAWPSDPWEVATASSASGVSRADVCSKSAY